ncbi:hypothetical protein PVAP13_2KG203421 [Panicum virgatum]|uniref:Uncharacterized protein n=1 Tax=Panicum virgatum TaxID=38727 RepID=A0A8T0W9W4_PANVG|nr:hypothetical protein PVAP13_2KG203421 [Panicum virgatum]
MELHEREGHGSPSTMQDAADRRRLELGRGPNARAPTTPASMAMERSTGWRSCARLTDERGGSTLWSAASRVGQQNLCFIFPFSFFIFCFPKVCSRNLLPI